MSGAADKEATFSLNLETNSGEVAADAASELEELRQKISGSNDAVKQMGASLRSLRGNTDEVKAAKAQLKAMIDSERNAVSSANLQLLKQGVTYEKLAGQAKKLGAEQKALADKMKAEGIEKAKAQTDAAANAMKLAGGPVEGLTGKFESLKKVLGGAGGVMGALTLAAAGLVAAITIVSGAVIALGVSLVRFIVEGADAARTLNLIREASTGSAQNARNLGTQVDALASKLATPKARLNDLASELARTRLSGQAIVDTFNLVGQASEAMGDSVGKQLQDIVTRSQITKRIQINPLELQGTGLKFTDIAAALATQMHVGVKAAQAALFEGRVKLDDGAKALRAAVEKRFGEINARKLLTLDVQIAKFKENLGALTSDVNLEPLLKGFAELGSLFTSSTVAGATLKSLVTLIGNGLGPAFKGVVPIAKQFIKGLIIGALDVAIAFLTLKKTFAKTFGGDNLKQIDLMKLALVGAKAPLDALALVLGAIGNSLALVGKAKDDFAALGAAIASGVGGGVDAGTPGVRSSIGKLADEAKAAFKDALGIHSPSKVFAGFGFHIAEGVAGGVRAGAPRAAAAVTEMAPMPPMQGGGRSNGGRAGVVVSGGIHVHIEAPAGGANAAALTDTSFLEKLTRAVEQALASAGVPTASVPTS